jgi:hypothetical protein
LGKGVKGVKDRLDRKPKYGEIDLDLKARKLVKG